MYGEIQEALERAGEDESVVCAVVTGAGDYYCSGNDFSNFTQIPPEGPQKMAAEAKDILRYSIEVPMEQKRVSPLVRCPHFEIIQKWYLGIKMFREVSSVQGVF